MNTMGVDLTMAGYYAKRAREYERVFHKPERQQDLTTLREFVGRTLAGRDVLEIACGTGYWTEILSTCAAAVTAIDINEEVLEIARAKPLARERVQFHRGDAWDLPPFPQLFTGGLAGFWWSHIPKGRLREFLAGAQQAFAPGAKIVFIDNVYAEGSSTPLSRTDSDGNTYQIRKLDDGSAYEVLKNFPTEKELRQTVDRFADSCEIQFLQYYWTLTYSVSRAKGSPSP